MHSVEYIPLEITASHDSTEIWLGDMDGHLVQKETGVLKTALLAGDYVVEFGLGTTNYPVSLHAPVKTSQRDLEAGPSCPRPALKLSDN